MHVTFLILCMFIMFILIGCSSNDADPIPDVPGIANLNVSTFAGLGAMGYENNVKEESLFSFPSGLALGEDGVIYIADTRNHRIRAIHPDGQITTIAGTTFARDSYGLPRGGMQDGTPDEARFNEPMGLAIDQDGVIYIADSENGAIRYIDSSGDVQTFVDGLNYPTDVVINDDGQLFVTETLQHRIIKIESNQEWSVLAGGGYEQEGDWYVGAYQDGNGEQAQFNEPSSLAFGSDGTLYVSDSANQRIRAITPDGEVTTIAGSGSEMLPGTNYTVGGYVNGPSDEARFNFPKGLHIDDDGFIFVADTHNHKIRVITPDQQVKTLAGIDSHGHENGEITEATFDGPFDLLTIEEGALIIADRWNHSIRKIQFEKQIN